jgi:hypothetical protein
MRIFMFVVALAAASGAQSANGIGELPPDLATYRTWKTLTRSPQMVPGSLGLLCRNLSPEELEAARRDTGPHFKLWAHTYANPAAFATLETAGVKTFPAGAILAKAKFTDPMAAHGDGVAFMTKHSKGEFAESDGWEFQYYPRGAGASYAHCIECHRTGNSRDYVFSRLSPEEPRD